MGRKGFKDLLVWQKAKDLAVKIYHVSDRTELRKDFGLRDQMRRSAISVASNLAEGDERGTDREAIRFFYMAKGSVTELRTPFQIAYDVGYVERSTYDSVEVECVQLGKMIGSLIRARNQATCL